MGRPELGAKCTCTGCNERFYDLNRAPAICPKCGAEQQPQKPRAAWPTRGVAGPRRPYRAPEPAAADEDAVPLTAVDNDDDDGVEDDDDDAVIADSDDDDVEIIIEPDHDSARD